MMTRAMWIGAALLGLTAGTGFGAVVTIDDSGDGSPKVTLSPDLANLTVTPGFETVSISGTLPVAATGAIVPPGIRQVVLAEVPTDFNFPTSDVVVLGAFFDTTSQAESIRLEFGSDPVTPSPNIPIVATLPETGLPQDISAAIGSLPGLQITVISDLQGSEPTPLPASAWGGLALLAGLAAWRIARRRKARLA